MIVLTAGPAGLSRLMRPEPPARSLPSTGLAHEKAAPSQRASRLSKS